MGAHRERALHAGERLLGPHRDDGDLTVARLGQLQRQLEPVLVAGVQRAVAGVANEQVVGPELGRARRVGDELRADGDVHGADATYLVPVAGRCAELGVVTAGIWFTLLPMTDALAGIRIADFSRVLAGPVATMVLGDLGADVVKIERPVTGDDTRAWGPPWSADGVASYYLGVNRNKRSIALDLKDPDDLATARALAIGADVVIENFRPGVMARAGLDHATLSAERPDLVSCRIAGLGFGDVAGYDFLAQAVGRADVDHR